jgi:hypothetical protein
VSVGIVRAVDDMRSQIRVVPVAIMLSLGALACGGGDDNTAYDKALGAAYVSSAAEDAPKEAAAVIDQLCAGAGVWTAVGNAKLAELGFKEDGTGTLPDEPKLDAAVAAKLGETIAKCPGMHEYFVTALLAGLSADAPDDTKVCLIESIKNSTLTGSVFYAVPSGEVMPPDVARLVADVMFSCQGFVQAISDLITEETGLFEPGTDGFTCVSTGLASSSMLKEMVIAGMTDGSPDSESTDELTELLTSCMA